MSDLLSSESWAAVVSDPRFFAALGIGLLTGLVRGFSGFGAALVHVPLMSAVYGPQIAVPSFAVADIVTGLIFLGRGGIWRKVNWRELAPMAGAALATIHFGTLILEYADPAVLRWGISAMVALAVVVLACGWRYRGQPTLVISIGVGALAGVMSGAVQIAGPPIFVYWLGGVQPADVVRASFLFYFSFLSAISLAAYTLHGLITVTLIQISVGMAPVMYLGLWLGTRLFHLASEKTYRSVAYVIVTLGAIISLPLFDDLLR